MSKDLSDLAIIRLQTELENAIGFKEHFLMVGDFKLVALWEEQIANIIDDIIELGV